MKLCVVPWRPVDGNIPSHVVAHERLIELSVTNGAEIVLFPELLLTGYDRALARDLAIDLKDHHFDVFRDTNTMPAADTNMLPPSDFPDEYSRRRWRPGSMQENRLPDPGE